MRYKNLLVLICMIFILSACGGSAEKEPQEAISSVAAFASGASLPEAAAAPPVAMPDNYNVQSGQLLTVPAPGVLGNDTLGSGSIVQSSQARYGVVSLNSNGSFTYMPPADFGGVDSFTYTIRSTDGQESTVTVTLRIGGGFPAPVNSPVALENAKTGTTAWQLSNPSLSSEIEGYASATSVAKGESLNFYVNTDAASFNIDIYRMGYYGGKGARLMQSISAVTGKAQPKPCLNAGGVIECNWTVSRTISIPNTVDNAASDSYWASGVYLAKLTTNDSRRKDSYIIFVVRDDSRAATYVVQLPDSTYQAYNHWGGKSLYTGCRYQCDDDTNPANTVSFNRPYGPSTNPAAAYGVGAGEFITNVQPVAEGYPISSAGWDYNMVRWMERQGYDIKYISNMDLHERPSVMTNAKAFISVGHDEYYSRTMRDRLVSFIDSGINLAFFSANQVYWQVRFGNGEYGSNKTNRNMTCYRLGGDPVTDPMLKTALFRNLGIPEAAFVGSQYIDNPVMGDVHVTNAAHWLYTGTGATNSTVLKGLLGYEINAIIPGTSPGNVVSLALSPYNSWNSDMTYYTASSTSQIFATGTMHWAWGLDDFISNKLRNNYTNSIAQAMTNNVFRAIAEQDLFTLQSVSNRYFISIPAGVVEASQTLLGRIPINNSKTNQWRILPYGDGTYQVISRANGLCLDAYGESAGSPVGTWECNAMSNQRWRFNDLGNGRFAIVDQQSLLCVVSETSVEGGRMILQTCNNSTSQQWQQSQL